MDGSRLACAVCWLITLTVGLMAAGLGDPGVTFLAWGAAVVMTLVTLAATRPGADERLAHARPYRAVAAAVLVLALCGCVLALVPDASSTSEAFGVYFGIAALLAYRALVAHGPRRAIVSVLILIWAWLPFVLVTSIGCKCRDYEQLTHWSETASEYALAVFLYALPVLAASALFAFRPRRDALPEARVL